MDVATTADGEPVQSVAAALADVLHARVRVLEDSTGGEVPLADRVLAVLDEADVSACAMPASPDPRAACWSVIARAAKPVLLVPRLEYPQYRRISRALLPLDGTAESAEAVRELAALLDEAGADLLVLHVFDAGTVPMFWDQRSHAHRAWADEFLSRTGAPRHARMELRSGSPAEHVVKLARTEDIDLIALGWSRRLSTGRAQTVRESVLHAPAPVLLLPVGRALDESRVMRSAVGQASR
jgi:nucleotide-binding universal stress UspA family protein